MVESFFAALKNERVHRTQYPTRDHAYRDVVRYIEFWYNSKRRHSGLQYRTPQHNVLALETYGLVKQRCSCTPRGP
jgi:Integrase core domain